MSDQAVKDGDTTLKGAVSYTMHRHGRIFRGVLFHPIFRVPLLVSSKKPHLFFLFWRGGGGFPFWFQAVKGIQETTPLFSFLFFFGGGGERVPRF